LTLCPNVNHEGVDTVLSHGRTLKMSSETRLYGVYASEAQAT
jgi:hypothetical protein